MSRFSECDDYKGEVDQILAQGRWERNSRAALKSKRGQKALALIREALLALPEKRLIEGALCTVGGPERVPELTDAEIDAHIAGLQEAGLWGSARTPRELMARWMREERAEERKAITKNTEGQGCGVCLNGALLWYLKVRTGADPAEAFASLPSVVMADSGDPPDETARLAAKEAGLAYTLAWNLAYRNDETYRGMTPEERYTAFLAWIDRELAESAAA